MSTTDATSPSQWEIVTKILVAIVGSDASISAVDHAISLCSKYNAELFALHVVHTDADLFGPHETSEFMTKMRDEGEKYFDKVKIEVKEKTSIKTEIISSANVSSGILDYADLKVIGTRGTSGFEIITWKCCITYRNLCTLSSFSSKIIVAI